jgi:5-methylcytosine-specific restriction endonuclease McrA
MKLSISNPKVRKAVFKAYRKRCFFTGRPLTEDEMVIDHLVPKSRGGKDSFENFVLTFRDFNLGKSNKLDEELVRMKWSVITVYAPRAIKIL